MIELIHEIHERKARAGQPVVSFEFFPPKTPEGEVTLFSRTLPELLACNPDYCSVTYGAGGSTREKTLSIVDRIQTEFGLTAMAHLTCVNATREDLHSVLTEARTRGIRNILALRGDPPGGTGAFVKTEGGFEYSHELVGYIKQLGGFSIGTAGFPEGHIACLEGREVDWRRLKAKIDRGADFVITQLFFNNQDFYRFRDFLQGLGVRVPLFPGIIPILSGNQIKKFTALCGAALPADLLAALERIGPDEDAATQFGVEYATRQTAELLKAGAPGVHFYTLNKSNSTVRVLKNLGLA